uniref:Uncharacterized protein n=1 Tax=Rhizophora mucronata TaxID=61149 RepID=A0A2P2L6E2_RHIMU
MRRFTSISAEKLLLLFKFLDFFFSFFLGDQENVMLVVFFVFFFFEGESLSVSAEFDVV